MALCPLAQWARHGMSHPRQCRILRKPAVSDSLTAVGQSHFLFLLWKHNWNYRLGIGEISWWYFSSKCHKDIKNALALASHRWSYLWDNLDRKFGPCEQDIHWFMWYLMKWEAFRPRVYQSVFSWGWRIFPIVLNGHHVFFKCQCRVSFSCWVFRHFFCAESYWLKRCTHRCHFLVSQPIRVEEGRDYRLYYGWTTMEKLILLVSEYLFSLLAQIAGLP